MKFLMENDARPTEPVVAVIGDPLDGRPLMTLAVDSHGRASVEVGQGDMERAIRQLNRVLEEARLAGVR